MVCYRRCLSNVPPFLKIGGDPRCPEAVVAELGGDAGRGATANVLARTKVTLTRNKRISPYCAA